MCSPHVFHQTYLVVKHSVIFLPIMCYQLMANKDVYTYKIGRII